MTTDPTQPDSQETPETTVSAASSDDATSQAAAAATPVAEATSDAESVGARDRKSVV